jgi:hypothetical protein
LLVGSVLSLGLLGVPLLLLGTGAALSAAPGGAGGGRTAAASLARAQNGYLGSTKVVFQAPATTTTVSPVTTTTEPLPTTTTAPPPPPTTTTTTDPADVATGLATWYSEAAPGRCASPWLPKGTSLTVEDLATGVTITCLVDDREAANPGRVVDLSPSGFASMAPLSQGTIQVTISW